MAKNMPSNAEDMGLTPGQGTKILHATWVAQPKQQQQEIWDTDGDEGLGGTGLCVGKINWEQ